MRLEPAMLGLAEIEGEGLEDFFRAEPDEAVRPQLHIGLEDILVTVANPRVHAIGGDDEIGVGKLQIELHLPLEVELDAERLAARLQDVEKPAAPDADEAMARRAHAPTLDDDFDVVPMVEGALDCSGRLGIAAAHVLHGRVGEDDAPAEGVIGPVSLDDPHRMGRVHLLHQQSEIEARRAAADTGDAHGSILRRQILYI